MLHSRSGCSIGSHIGFRSTSSQLPRHVVWTRISIAVDFKVFSGSRTKSTDSSTLSPLGIISVGAVVVDTLDQPPS